MTGYCIHLARAYEKIDTEDLAQELAILAWKLRNRPKPYVKVALRHRAIDYSRARARERGLFIGGLEAPGRDVDNEVAGAQVREAIERGGQLVLDILSGLSLREIARLRGVSAKTIHKRISRIRAELN